MVSFGPQSRIVTDDFFLQLHCHHHRHPGTSAEGVGKLRSLNTLGLFVSLFFPERIKEKTPKRELEKPARFSVSTIVVALSSSGFFYSQIEKSSLGHKARWQKRDSSHFREQIDSWESEEEKNRAVGRVGAQCSD